MFAARACETGRNENVEIARWGALLHKFGKVPVGARHARDFHNARSAAPALRPLLS
jgi:hypothetical protein